MVQNFFSITIQQLKLTIFQAIKLNQLIFHQTINIIFLKTSTIIDCLEKKKCNQFLELFRLKFIN